jgi:hypothetical protein
MFSVWPGTLCMPIADLPHLPLRRHQFSVGAIAASSLGWLSAAADCGRVRPEPVGNWQGIDLEPLPPGDFITGLMQLPMMAATKRNGELVADFQAQRPWLGKP